MPIDKNKIEQINDSDGIKDTATPTSNEENLNLPSEADIKNLQSKLFNKLLTEFKSGKEFHSKRVDRDLLETIKQTVSEFLSEEETFEKIVDIIEDQIDSMLGMQGISEEEISTEPEPLLRAASKFEKISKKAKT